MTQQHTVVARPDDSAASAGCDTAGDGRDGVHAGPLGKSGREPILGKHLCGACADATIKCVAMDGVDLAFVYQRQ